METLAILRQLLEDDTVTLSAATAASVFSNTTSANCRHVRIINNTGADLYLKYQTSRTATATASPTVWSIKLAADGVAALDISNTIGLSAYSAGGGTIRVEVYV